VNVVTPANTRESEAILFQPTGIWNQADLHLHTTYSDGSATPAELIEHVFTRSTIRVVAITDHDEIEGAQEAQRLAKRRDVDVIVGEEVSTAHGHLIGLFLRERIPPGLDAFETTARIHEQGGLAIAPHPFDASVPSLGVRMSRDAFRALPLDGIETFNASIFLPWRAANDEALRAAEMRGTAQIGGSDAHALCAVATGRTWFPGRRAADVFAAIQSSTTHASGRYLSHGGHARQIFDMVRNMGIGSFTRHVMQNAEPMRT
jgi:predicted metal-dependent phosphoesterase TrpH